MDWLKEILANEELKSEEKQEQIQKELPKYFIPKEKFNTANGRVKDLEAQLGERDEQLATLKKQVKDNSGLTAKIEELQDDNKKVKEETETKIKQQKFDFALELKLRDYKVKNVKAVKALLAVDKLILNDDETFTGLEEQITKLKETDEYLFGDVTVSGTGKPEEGKPDYKGKNPWSKDTFNLTEQGKILKENPELAKVLQSQAKK